MSVSSDSTDHCHNFLMYLMLRCSRSKLDREQQILSLRMSTVLKRRHPCHDELFTQSTMYIS